VPSPEEIAAYQEVRYPAWIESCRTTLRGLHLGRDEPDPVVTLHWSMSNQGTRPASQVRVEFEAKGKLMLMRRSDPADDDEVKEDGRSTPASTVQAPRFPSSPT
jgi:hypothetical protein